MPFFSASASVLTWPYMEYYGMGSQHRSAQAHVRSIDKGLVVRVKLGDESLPLGGEGEQGAYKDNGDLGSHDDVLLWR